uniref:hypothetical protein n=1 Tax=Ilumatobacter nonamiensis TaxID=467093 RepID=UPI00058C9C67
RALAPGGRIRPGDVVSMRAPDAAIDVGGARPQLAIDGAARVVMLKGNGAVALDTRVDDDHVTVPPCTAIIAVQADGG